MTKEQIYSYHPGLKTSFQKTLVSTEIRLKTKHVTLPTVTDRPPWGKIRCCSEPLSTQLGSKHQAVPELPDAVTAYDNGLKTRDSAASSNAHSASLLPPRSDADTATTSVRLLR